MAATAANLTEEQKASRQKEFADVNDILYRVNSTRDRLEKARILGEFFDFVANSTYVVGEIFDVVVAKVNEFADEPKEIYEIFKPSMTRLCEKLKSMKPDAVIPGCGPRAVRPNIKGKRFNVLGSGSYGAVISPALPNVKDRAVVEFSGNVTKLFFKSDEKHKIMEKLDDISRTMGADPAHRINNYAHKYKIGNLPRSVVSEMERKKGRTLRASENVYAVHMPNLGTDMKDSHIESHRVALRRIPVTQVVSQMVKLLKQTRMLAEHGWVHGDIREHNIMIHPETGVMAIIDFDWLKPYDEFLDEYPFGFYNNPPEFLLYENMDSLVDKDYIDTDDVSNAMDEEKLDEYITYQKHGFKTYYSTTDRSTDDLHDLILEANVENAKEMKDEYENLTFEGIFSEKLPYFDNFGLGLTLLNFIARIYPGCIQETDIPADEDPRVQENIVSRLRGSLSDNGRPYTDVEIHAIVSVLRNLSFLFTNMSNFEYRYRPTPEQAYKIADGLYNEFAASMRSESGNELRRLAVMKGNLSALPAINGGGRRLRKTLRKRRLSKRKNTRRSRK